MITVAAARQFDMTSKTVAKRLRDRSIHRRIKLCGRRCRSRGVAPTALRGQQIAAEVGISPATFSRILRRLGLNRLAALAPAEPMRLNERQHPAN
ncbi:hypothetical protein [Bradyrhizobium sp. BR 1433]|uniref:hypothetical protein n=1 Tax=Bradyrhizobium sp. BR 1433 TaxID=3447967 RepID=UPI003EE6870F